MTRSIPAAHIRVEIEDLYEAHGHRPENIGWPKEWEKGLMKIAQRWSVSFSSVATYMVRLNNLWSSLHNSNIVIFIEGEEWGERRLRPHIKRGHSYLPRHSSVIGYITGGRALLNTPIGASQENLGLLRAAVVGALIQSGDNYAEDHVDQLIRQGHLEFRRYCGLPKSHRREPATN